MTKTKTKAVTAPVPQTDQEAARAIARVGELQNELVIAEAALNEQIALAKESHAAPVAKIKDDMSALTEGLSTWAAVNRARLTQDGRSKTVAMLEGTVSWRHDTACGEFAGRCRYRQAPARRQSDPISAHQGGAR